MSIKDVVDAVTEAIRLADRVEALSDKVTEMARAHREDARELRRELHGLDKRVVKIEALVEYSQRSGSTRRLKDEH